MGNENIADRSGLTASSRQSGNRASSAAASRSLCDVSVNIKRNLLCSLRPEPEPKVNRGRCKDYTCYDETGNDGSPLHDSFPQLDEIFTRARGCELIP